MQNVQSEKLNDLLCETFEKNEDRKLKALLQYEIQTHALEELQGLFSDAEISFLPLKGALLRKYYPAPWMRECSDIDVYVDKKDLDRADGILCENGFARQTKCSHHIAYIAKNGALVELHFSLAEKDKLGARAAALNSERINAMFCSCPEETAEYYLYHLLHMAGHFLDGGCGRKFFADLWILNHLSRSDKNFGEKKNAILKEASLCEFDNVCSALSEYWFGEAESCDIELAEYVLSGGSYGTPERKAAANVIRFGGKGSYILHRAFPGLEAMREIYPVLEHAPLLLPFMWVARAFGLLRRGFADQFSGEISASGKIEKSDIEKQKAVLKKLGLY